ncbi:tRNA (adenosine(37)-N6)-threonylcarbamoyltransferase complex dimerization subunit type 1 TsaB [Paractinoplanes lichenicola]|uniref:tRNA (Adenosine(37)-N6)-threonylcarbamoyltransferase complex dimerization subunit type 1 TsaB n=1 Tax=Paractinoplanes lichenicola TaxID=2802976 RepID=A0ABS1VQJ7_9ACTN|nr:tRNA (adenosine(37)-N6)-threonylcarbamoyltransferase complex dimerization subunit type 1 TsaB [Actinoplanes lichenicola]MBL7257003.1 tRNA (adenosine(37)-N6)-threonylcarbamoyltransferase complex dimerization subunit type 1 TsaB [Actinoplanes lichenicola]
MLVLALDTATPASTAALVEVTADGLRGLAERRTVDPRAHGEKLAPEIEATLAEAGVRPRDLGAIVAGLGPGPFTGLRVGLVTAASMGQALGIPTYGVCSLDGLGRAAGPGRVLIATDARRREVYFATYRDGVRVQGPDVARPGDVAAAIVRAGTPTRSRARNSAATDAAALAESETLEAAISLVGADAARVAAALARAEAAALIGQATARDDGVDLTGRQSEAPAIGVGGLVDRAAGEGALKYGDVFGVPVEEHLLYPPGAALVALAADRIRAGAPGEALTPLYLRRPDAVEPTGRKPVLT